MIKQEAQVMRRLEEQVNSSSSQARRSGWVLMAGAVACLLAWGCTLDSRKPTETVA